MTEIGKYVKKKCSKSNFLQLLKAINKVCHEIYVIWHQNIMSQNRILLYLKNYRLVMSDPLTPRRRSKRGRSEEDPSSPSNANGVDEPVTRKSNKL